MYTAFFALSEVPFSIAPNPRFLYMSDRHREALSHLTYGLGDTGGFVLLTGEVGTGKTTLSRCLMEQLPENIQSAFILNPTLSSQELLATICDELKVKYRKSGATLKTLTDKIQEKLLANHKNDINTLLIIDEAQHLQPEVLEQLRLLTNLETNTKKLLQVILIGQPELQQLLKRRDLRQLAQRITARYHLLPLTSIEVANYIKHRLSVVDCHRPIFNNRAVKTIHKLSQGIPRLINLLCDRSLMNAYNNNDAVVNKKCVMKASLEALGDEYQSEFWWQKPSIKIGILSISFAVVLFAGIWWGGEYHLPPESTSVSLENNAIVVTEQSKIADAQLTDKNKAIMQALEQNSSSDLSGLSPNEKDVEILSKLVEQKLEKPEPEPVKQLASDDAPQSEIKVTIKVNSEDSSFRVNAVDGVSDELLARFQSAIDETANEKTVDYQSSEGKQLTQTIPTLSKMPTWVQEGVPKLEFDQHIYASDGEGWVRVNGRDRYEGDKISEGLFLDKILPQKVELNYQGERFSLPALSSW
ncbi:MAG: AAA family ATPase [Colwellia sp.]|nr:AAA family ATPase [Colwellia sp.]